MSNFSAFNSKHLERLLEPFAPGMAPYVTPIKYEAFTPDLFCLLLRTTGSDQQEHFFVSLEYDYLESLEAATELIEDWHGPVIRFWRPGSGPENSDDKTDKPTLQTLSVESGGPYYAALAEVERPTGDGYWAASVLIMPGDNIDEKLAGFNSKQQEVIRKGLAGILKHSADPDAPFLESFTRSTRDTVVDGINKTDIAVSIHLKKDGSPEFFYNYAAKPASD
jgi:hypothetical protein